MCVCVCVCVLLLLEGPSLCSFHAGDLLFFSRSRLALIVPCLPARPRLPTMCLRLPILASSPTCPQPWAFVWSARRTVQVTMLPYRAQLAPAAGPGSGVPPAMPSVGGGTGATGSPLRVSYSAASLGAARAARTAASRPSLAMAGVGNVGSVRVASPGSGGYGSPTTGGGGGGGGAADLNQRVSPTTGLRISESVKLARLAYHARMLAYRDALDTWREAAQSQRLSAVEQVLRRFGRVARSSPSATVEVGGGDGLDLIA